MRVLPSQHFPERSTTGIELRSIRSVLQHPLCFKMFSTEGVPILCAHIALMAPSANIFPTVASSKTLILLPALSCMSGSLATSPARLSALYQNQILTWIICVWLLYVAPVSEVICVWPNPPSGKLGYHWSTITTIIPITTVCSP